MVRSSWKNPKLLAGLGVAGVLCLSKASGNAELTLPHNVFGSEVAGIAAAVIPHPPYQVGRSVNVSLAFTNRNVHRSYFSRDKGLAWDVRDENNIELKRHRSADVIGLSTNTGGDHGSIDIAHAISEPTLVALSDNYDFTKAGTYRIRFIAHLSDRPVVITSSWTSIVLTPPLPSR